RISFSLLAEPPPISTLFPYTTLFRSGSRPDFDAGKVSVFNGYRQKHLWFTNSKATPYYSKLTERPSSTSRLATNSRLAVLQMPRSEEHTSELQSRENLVCRLLLEKKK